jgi:hypothetical protein
MTNDTPPITSLDAQLAELIEVVWACETAARREDRIDAAIRYASNWASGEGAANEGGGG